MKSKKQYSQLNHTQTLKYLLFSAFFALPFAANVHAEEIEIEVSDTDIARNHTEITAELVGTTGQNEKVPAINPADVTPTLPHSAIIMPPVSNSNTTSVTPTDSPNTPSVPAIKPNYEDLVFAAITSPSAYVQMPRANLELAYAVADATTTLHPTHLPTQKGLWSKFISKNLSLNGKNAFELKQQLDLIQVGYHFPRYQVGDISHESGVYIATGSAKQDFFDRFTHRYHGKTAYEHISAGKTKTNMLGLYYNTYWKNQAYFNVLAQVAQFKNHYKPTAQAHLSQKGLNALLSLTSGKVFHFHNAWSVEPHAQLVSQVLRLNALQQAWVNIQADKSYGVRGKIGTKLTHHHARHTLTLSANVWQDFVANNSVQIDKFNYREHYAKTWAELGIQAEVKVNPNFAIYGGFHKEYRLSQAKRHAYNSNVGLAITW